MKLTEEIEIKLEAKGKFDPRNSNANAIKKWAYDTKQVWHKADDDLRDNLRPLDKKGKSRLLNKLSRVSMTKNIKGKRHFLLFRGESHNIQSKIKGKKIVHDRRSSWTPDVYKAIEFGGKGINVMHDLADGDMVKAKTLAAWVSEDDILTSPIMYNSKGVYYGEWEIILQPHSSEVADHKEIETVVYDSDNGFYTGSKLKDMKDKKSDIKKRDLADKKQREYNDWALNAIYSKEVG
jgi:hypothetical protein